MSTTNAHKNVFKPTLSLTFSPCMAQKFCIISKATMNTPCIVIGSAVCRLIYKTHIFAIDSQHRQVGQTTLNHTIPLIVNFHNYEYTYVLHKVNNYLNS